MVNRLIKRNVIAVDFDGSLADNSVVNFNNYRSDLLGKPIDLMVNRVKEWLAKGIKVVIFTARVHPSHGKKEVVKAEKAIKKWCLDVFGCELEVTCMKDPIFMEIWDDRAIGLVENTGMIATPDISKFFCTISCSDAICIKHDITQ